MSIRLDQARIHRLTITQDEAKPGIEFSRGDYNYLVAPAGGSIAFSPGSESGAGATTGTGAHLAVTHGEVIPGLNNNLINLGSTSYHWNVIHGKKLALNASEEPTENFYVNGTTRFAIGNNDTVGDKRVIVGSSGKRYLSLGGAGMQAYSDAGAGSALYLQYQGGSITIGQSTSVTSPVTVHGNLLAGAKDTYNIGSEEKPWNLIYGTHVGNIRGVIETNPTSATRYNPLFINTGNAASVSTTAYTRRTNMDYNIYMLQGTASALGYVYLELGNNIAAQTEGNKYGAVRLYNTDTIYADLRGNNIGSYGGFRVSGKKGDYHGILLGDATSGMTVMSIDGSHQGLYNQAKSKWIIYFNGDKSICIGGSIVVADYPIVLNATTNVKGNVLADTTETTDRSIRVKNANGETGIYTSTNRGLYDFTNSHWIIYVKKDVTDRAYIPTNKGLTVENTTDAGSTTTGALIVSGGVGVAKNIYSGQKINAAQGFGVNATTGTGVGISLYNGSNGTSAPTYGLMFAKTSSFGTHGSVTGDWATYFTMSETSTTTRGWIFRHTTNNVASISGAGDLSLNGNIIYTNSTYTDYPMIKFITGTNDGAGIVIGGGGLAVFGSGESASSLVTTESLAGNTETTYITSDGAIHFITNCQTIADRVVVILNNSREFYPSVTNTGKLGTATYNWSAVHARALTSADALGITSAGAMTMTSGGNFKLSVTGTTTLTSSSTIYIGNTSASSILFKVNSTECARFNTAGHFIPGATTTYNIGSAAKLWNQMNTHHLRLLGATDATMTASSTNPRITFAELDADNALSQPVHLIYTDYDNYRSPAGLKVIGGTSASPAWFEVEGSIYSGRNIYTTHPTGGETNINVTHGTNEYLMLWGNNSSGGRGLWDTTKGSVITVTDTASTFHGNASTATSLANGRTLKVALGSTSASTAFNGTANVHDIGVSGTLGAANGGTGNTSYTANRLIYSSSATKLSSSNVAISGYNLTSTSSTTDYIAYKVGNSNGTVSLYAATNRGLYDNTLGDWLVYLRSSDSTLRAARPFYVDGTVTAANTININRSTSIANNYSARLNFTVTQTDNNISATGYIACYDDLDANSYGVNMVVNSTSGLYLTAGEGAAGYLSSNPSTGEDVHICADSAIYFHTNCNTTANATTSCYITTAGYIYGARVYGAVWNDYAEYRSQFENISAGRVAYCKNDGKLRITTERLQRFEGVISDTFGFAIGETDNAKTPLAVSGRVLVYTYEPRDTFNSGDCVCAAPNGTVSKMTREEIVTYPDRIVGIVSEIPDYETWGTGEVPVNGRIWIKVK